MEVLLYEFKADLNAYLLRLPPTAPVRSLSALIRFNDAHKDREMPLFDQELLHQAEAKGPLTDKAYLEARATCLKSTRTQGIDSVIAEHKLDALVSLTSGPAWLLRPDQGDSDSGGCFLTGRDCRLPAHHRAVGAASRTAPSVSPFFAGAFSEPQLIKLASGFESIARGRTAPRFLPSVSA